MNDRRLLLVVLACMAPAAAIKAADAAANAETLTLRGAVERALSSAPELAIARATAGEAAASARAAGGTFRPEAVFTTTPGYAVGLPAAVAGRVPALAGVEVRQTLYDASARAGALSAAAAAVELEGRLESARREVALAAVEAYALAWRGQALVEAVRRRLELRGTLLTRARALEREGRVTALEVDRAALDEARARQRLLQAESERDLSLLSLKRLTGLGAGAPVVLGEDPGMAGGAVGAGETVEVARAADPFLGALHREVEDLRLASRLASRRVQPVVVAAGQYQRLSSATGYDDFYLGFEEDSAVVGVSISVPILTGGRLKEAGSRARAALERAEGRREARERELEAAAHEAEAALRNALAGLSVARQAEGVAGEELRVALALTREGRGDAGAVERAGLEGADAVDQRLRAEHEVTMALARLLGMRGELLSSLEPR